MKALFIFILLSAVCISSISKNLDLYSPSKNIMIKVETGDSVQYSVYFNRKMMILPSLISLVLPGRVLGIYSHFKNSSVRSVNEIITPVVPQRRNKIHDNYNELTVTFREGFSIIFRAYDDAIAWRFKTNFNSDIKIVNEIAEINFTDNYKMFIPIASCR